MGILPGGRGNDFARANGIPLDPEAACDVIADGTETLLDVGDVDGRTFIGIASLGFDSLANHHANQAPARLGRGVYLYAALRTLATFQPGDVHADDRRRARRRSPAGASPPPTRGPTAAGWSSPPTPTCNDGRLDVVLIRGSSRAALPAHAARGVQGSPRRQPDGRRRARRRGPRRHRPPVHRLRRRRPDRASRRARSARSRTRSASCCRREGGGGNRGRSCGRRGVARRRARRHEPARQGAAAPGPRARSRASPRRCARA